MKKTKTKYFVVVFGQNTVLRMKPMKDEDYMNTVQDQVIKGAECMISKQIKFFFIKRQTKLQIKLFEN